MAASKKPLPRSSKAEVIHILKKPAQTRRKVSTTIPEEAMPVFEAMRKRLKMTTAQFLNSLIAYGCWCEKEHHLTGEAVRQGGEAERHMWVEIIRDFGKPDKTGAFFDHAAMRRAVEVAKEAQKKIEEQSETSE